MWRIEQRIERLNDLGFDVDELDIVTDFDGDEIRIQPEGRGAGHHRRELQALTGLNVEDAQAAGCSTTSRRSPPTSTSGGRTAAWSRTGG